MNKTNGKILGQKCLKPSVFLNSNKLWCIDCSNPKNQNDKQKTDKVIEFWKLVSKLGWKN